VVVAWITSTTSLPLLLLLHPLLSWTSSLPPSPLRWRAPPSLTALPPSIPRPRCTSPRPRCPSSRSRRSSRSSPEEEG
jgi:hypothetical protein